MIRSRLLAGLSLVLGLVLGLPPLLATSGEVSRDADAIDYQRDVRPLLAEHCFACHGPDAAAREGDLRLDLREGAIERALVPGDAGRSLLLARVRGEHPDGPMPPAHSKDPGLTAAEIEMLERWIEEGAEYGLHWSFRPLPVEPEPLSSARIDEFLDARITAAEIGTAPPAEARVLARRLSFDLLGLPPSPEQVEAFVTDSSDTAYAELVEELLASPHHGERLANYWLDLVRYGDSSGYHSDKPIAIHPYRDYVIQSFMENRPFDQFTREQLAGDLLPEAGDLQQAAAAYNRLNKTTDEGGAQPGEYLIKHQADRVRTTASVWLGVTVGCAECHDHKYDPIPQRDFYRLAAFFADVEEVGVYEHGREDRRPLVEVETLSGRAKVLATVSGEPRPVRVLARGNWQDESGELVQPGTLECLPTLPEQSAPASREDLARWIVWQQNPLTARVFVNRLWYLFFGEGLSRVLDDLGVQGEWPTHPELLDALAAEFVQSGWDVRHMIRLILHTRAYRRSARGTPELLAADPENRSFARQGRWRLDAEFVRDAALCASGLLERRIGGSSVKPYQPAGYWSILNHPARRWQASEGADQYRRGLYTHVQRTYLHPALLALDATSREECIARRPRSNTPTAALVLLNDPSFVEAACALAARVLRDGGERDAQRIEMAYRCVLQRRPEEREVVLLSELLENQREHYAAQPQAARELLSLGGTVDTTGLDAAEHAAWTALARVLLNTHEGITRE